MFPNDDICNADIARLAAMRLFKKYKKEGEKIRGLGKDEVNNLMRATYQAINMRINYISKHTLPTKRIFSHL